MNILLELYPSQGSHCTPDAYHTSKISRAGTHQLRHVCVALKSEVDGRRVSSGVR